ncbi:50S ribosome-binding GTPase [Clostridium gasigenes]|uniref:GTPase n=1 Tax=Clostridium gasigenes TaxID=94869 RepID=UPI001C0C5CFB|nr:GTPase [Clostridium gasigenes]MBU3134709.1 50S ribosome-binding GTPase [Clostridium gasigenes]
MDNYNFINDLFNKINEENKNILPANIMLIGKTGVGKSTLINNIFRENLAETGIGKPVTKHLKKITKEGVPINLYDSRGLELNPLVQKSVRDDINAEIDRIHKSRDINSENLIHIVWYCINAASNRIEEFEIEWIKELSGKIPVIIVLTQNFSDNAKELEKYIDNMNLNIRGIQRILSEPIKFGTIELPRNGLEELVEKTYQVLPQGIRRAFNNAQKVDLKKKVDEATKWALGYIGTSFGIGFSPIPFSDSAILIPGQVGMLAHITTIFGVKVDKDLLVAVSSGVGGIAGATIAGKTLVANIIKFIPGAGTIIGGVISGGTASVLTTALAFSYIEVMKRVAGNQYEGKVTKNEEISEMMYNELKKHFKNRK